MQFHERVRQAVERWTEEVSGEFRYVYKLLAPFMHNPAAPRELFREKEAENAYNAAMEALIERYFDEPEDLEIEETEPDLPAYLKLMRGEMTWAEFPKPWRITFRGEPLAGTAYAGFLDAFDELERQLFVSSRALSFFSMDDPSGGIFWDWQPLSWRSLAERYGLLYDSSIYMDVFERYFEEHGEPVYLRPYGGDGGVKGESHERLIALLETYAGRFVNRTDHDVYVHIIGTERPIDEPLEAGGYEFFRLKP